MKITVYNQMPQNTTIHWHGIAQTGSPWSDGTPGLTQAPIEPGDSFVYRFKASPAGTFWYHSHSRMSLLDGLYGALFIRPNSDSPMPWSMISNDADDLAAMAKTARDPNLVILSDWDRYTSDEYWAATEASQVLLFCVDSVLINGKGSVYCPGLDYVINQTSPALQEFALFNATVTDKGCFPFVTAIDKAWLYEAKPDLIPPNLQSGCIPSSGENETIEVDAADRWVSLNFVCATSFKTLEISIDEHDMWVYEIDGSYVEPTKVQVVTLWPGERYSVMVKLDKKPGAYPIRIPDYGGTQVISGYATLLYQDAQPMDPTTPYVTYGGEIPSSDTLTLADTTPFLPNPPSPTADEEFLLRLGRFNASYNYTITGKAMWPQDRGADQPLLYHPNDTTAVNPDLVIQTKNGSWVDLILVVGTLPGDPDTSLHTMHKHGSKTWRIGQALGEWNYSSVADAMIAVPEAFNLQTANYRDLWLADFLSAPFWVVLRYQVTEPGPWLFHCHNEPHLAGGMAMAIMDGVDVWPTVPPEYALGQHGWLVGDSSSDTNK
ncbi:MAG: hypothetical protein FRX48_06451 [Lasallia pustulata]|uniref:Multicopper oxidase n=1 Tax=Lasallia pustulata TaxID=136370 RepID=A0A5M8PK61_9LECA|nr:MAG: hypothetical protein FRX48_06451 [Lasallia pustulata]